MAQGPALFRALPALSTRIPHVGLGIFPTPITRLSLALALAPPPPPPFGRVPACDGDIWVKRDDLSALRYGGNKIRTLEFLFGAALAGGARRIWAVGAVGSNHALATVLHARLVGLEPGVMLFPQPVAACARENLVATLAERPAMRSLWSWASVPLAMYAERRRPHTAVMPPGGATPEGALGYVSAALEVVEQAVAGVAPLPRRVMVGAGSTCTSAGLLAGFRIAARLGLVEDRLVPDIIAVRVTPWPVTAAYRITALAARTTALVAALAGEARLEASRNELATRLRVTGRYLGRGYGHVTPAGVRAAAVFADAGGPPLDTCYSGKVGACLLEGLGTKPSGPTLFWATKSSRPLPAAMDLAGADVVPRPFARWLARPMPALPAAGNARISAS